MVWCYFTSARHTTEGLVVIQPKLETTLQSQWLSNPTLKHNWEVRGYPILAWNKIDGSVVIPLQFQIKSGPIVAAIDKQMHL